MSEFTRLLHKLKSKTKPGFAVECVFGFSECPAEAKYAILDTYSTHEEADAKAKQLSYECGHKYLTYRARPMGTFHSVITATPSTTVFTTDMKEMDAQYEERLKREHQLTVKEEEKKALIAAHLAESSVPGSPAHFVKLVYQAFKLDGEIKSTAEQLSTMTKEMTELERELASASASAPAPDAAPGWKEYATVFLTKMDEVQLLEPMMSWFKARHLE